MRQEKVCLLFKIDIRFLDPDIKQDAEFQAVWADAISKIVGGEAQSVVMVQDSDTTVCGEDISNGNFRRLQLSSSFTDFHIPGSPDDPDSGNANEEDSGAASTAEAESLRMAIPSELRVVDDSSRRINSTAYTVETDRRRLGRYDGGLNDPTPAPTLFPTFFPTLHPTVAPDPVSFTLSVIRTVQPDDGETPESEEARMSAALSTSVSTGTFGIELMNAANRAFYQPLRDGSVSRDYHAVTTLAIAIGERVIMDAPTSSPTSSSPTLQPTNSPITSRPTVLGETNQPTGTPTTSSPTIVPSGEPSTPPSMEPSGQPTSQPTSPTSMPTGMPTNYGLDKTSNAFDEYSSNMGYGVFVAIGAFLFFAWLVYKKVTAGDQKVKVAPLPISKSFGKDEEMKEMDELGFSVALSRVLKAPPAVSSRNKYIYAKPADYGQVMPSNIVVFSAQRSAENTYREENKVDDDELGDSATFRSMVRPLDYRSPERDSRVNPAMHARMSTSLASARTTSSRLAPGSPEVYPGQSRSVIGTTIAPREALTSTLDRLALSTNPHIQTFGTRTGVNVMAAAKGKKKMEHAVVLLKPLRDEQVARDLLFLTKSHFESNDIRVVKTGEYTGRQIAQGNLFERQFSDAHAYANHVPVDELGKELSRDEHQLFFDKMGVDWKEAQAERRIMTAAEFCKNSSISDKELYEQVWACSTVQIRVRKGIYIARVDGIADKYAIETGKPEVEIEDPRKKKKKGKVVVTAAEKEEALKIAEAKKKRNW